MVARDGIEPPTRGFSVPDHPLYSKGYRVLSAGMNCNGWVKID